MYSSMNYDKPANEYFFDVNESPLFIKDSNNIINILGKKQLNSLENTSLLDIFLSVSNIVEPHYHPNAAQLVYCISGSAVVSILNPFTNQVLNFTITPGQVTNVPKAWWHYEIATKDNTHLLAIFDAPNPEVVLGSDILKFTPAKVMAHTYCFNENEWKDITKNIKPDTYIGPYKECDKDRYVKNQPAYINQYCPNQNFHYQNISYQKYR